MGVRGRQSHGVQPAAGALLRDGAVQAATGDPLLRAAGVEGSVARRQGAQLVSGRVPATRAEGDQRVR